MFLTFFMEAVLLDNLDKLPHLIRFCLAPGVLECKYLPYAGSHKDPVASFPASKAETEPFGDSAEPLETEVPDILFQFFQQPCSVPDGTARTYLAHIGI
jgi:hypothetical protein